MALISKAYKAQNVELHAERPTYGAGGHRYVPYLYPLFAKHDIQSVLDYGCGKGTLIETLRRNSLLKRIRVEGYDPATRPKRPEPADLVVCVDVLEHVEPDCLDDVLSDINSLMLEVGYFVVATRPAKKTLPDGRNAHLIVEDALWWRTRIARSWRILQMTEDVTQPGEAEFIVKPL